jgi:hypothetical protein
VWFESAGAFLGSGFFIAPNIVVTSAHLLAAAAGTVRVHRPEAANPREVTSRILYPSKNDRANHYYPFPDLALATVDGPVATAWADLDSRPPTSGEKLTVRGFSTKTPSPEISPRELLVTVAGVDGSFLRIIGDEVTDGLSGGIVTRQGSRLVCAVLKASRDFNNARGGWITTTDALLEILPPEIKPSVQSSGCEGPGSVLPWKRKEMIIKGSLATGLMEGNDLSSLLLEMDARLQYGFSSLVRHSARPADQARFLVNQCLAMDSWCEALSALVVVVQAIRPDEASTVQLAEAVRSAVGGV